MKNYKNIMRIMMLIWLSVLLAGCLFTDPNNSTDSTEDDTPVRIPTEDELQEIYRQQWLENVKNINVNNRYFGKADIWGGGALDLYFWFVDGNLWDAWTDVPTGYVLHKLLTDEGNKTDNKTTFIDGNTAIMFIPSSASGTIAGFGVFYIVWVKDNKIYRTKSAWGWGGNNRGDAIHLKDWDGKTIPKGALEVGDKYYNLVVVGEPKK